MSQFYDQASLVMVPSGYKDGKLYSQKPLSTSGELSFSRGSDIEATRISSDGLIQKAKVNLLLQSNSFDTTWLNILTTSTSGQTGYDGSSDAWKLESTGGASSKVQQGVSVGGVKSYSVYAKAGTANFLVIGGVVNARYFDLSSGSVGILVGTNSPATIEAVGNGWYRCTMVEIGNTSTFQLYVANTNGTTTTSAGDNIYIQDAQLNYGLVAQDYQETTTAAVVSGITNDMPRLNYDPANPTCPSVILEPSRSNLIGDSEFFNNTSVWTQNPQITIDDNQDTSPEGVVNAARIYNNSGSATTIFYGASVNVGSAGTYTFSIFAKKGGLGWIRLRCLGFDAAANNNCWFDLENGVKGTNTFDEANIEDYGNGWFRISVKFTTSTDLTGTCYVYAADGDNDTTVASGASYYLSVYGAQLEAGAYPTSYIPTYGSSATRTADSCYKTGISSLIGQTEGTIFWDFQTDNVDLYKRFAISDGSTTNWIFVGIEITTGTARGYVRNGGSIQADIQGSANVSGGRVKIALAYRANDFALYVNGAQIGTDNGGTVPTCNSLDIGSQNPSSAVNAQSETNQALLFKTRLTNAQLAELTA